MPLRALDANDILKGVFVTLRRYFWALYCPLFVVVLGSMAVLSGCGFVAWKLITSLLPGHGESMSAGRLIDICLAASVFVVPALACVAIGSAVTAAVSITVLGHRAVLGNQPLTAREAWADARPHVRRTLNTQILSVLIVFGVFFCFALPAVVLGAALDSSTAVAFGLLLLIPGAGVALYVGGRLFYAAPVTVLEGMPPKAAMRRSWHLDRGVWWRTLGIAMLPGLVGRAATEVITGGAGNVAARDLPAGFVASMQGGQAPHLSVAVLAIPVTIILIAAVVAAILRAPLAPLSQGLLYIDRCIRTERLGETLEAAAGSEVSSAAFPVPPFPPIRPPFKPWRRRGTGSGDGGQPFRGKQDPVKGRWMIGVGWTLRIVGTCVGVTGYELLRQGYENGADGAVDFTAAGTWLIKAAGFPIMMIGIWVFSQGLMLIARGKRHTVKIIGSFAKLIYARYVLYLRSFSEDKVMSVPRSVFPWNTGEAMFFTPWLTQEESLVRRFAGIGQVVAVGQPEEDLPLPGAARGYLPRDGWQGVVSGLIRSAHVVAMSAGTGPGTLWEYTEAVRVLDLRRLVLLVYCGPAGYDAFRAAVSAEYAERRAAEGGGWPALPNLPDFPPLSRPRPTSRWKIMLRGGKDNSNWDFPLKGIVVFDGEKTPAFIRFDPTAAHSRRAWYPLRMVKRQFEPVLSELSALPHAQ
ncbi:hypothetical protein [Catenulispora pinisilvae]|uniref:hypothetical protein n=1 Tax=Catenulispora pinisilvae TaxID=2705253 RepID=UPI00189146E5|nr:hypothetical protein [Catenulispora pinisilvae]